MSAEKEAAPFDPQAPAKSRKEALQIRERARKERRESDLAQRKNFEDYRKKNDAERGAAKELQNEFNQAMKEGVQRKLAGEDALPAGEAEAIAAKAKEEAKAEAAAELEKAKAEAAAAAEEADALKKENKALKTKATKAESKLAELQAE